MVYLELNSAEYTESLLAFLQQGERPVHRLDDSRLQVDIPSSIDDEEMVELRFAINAWLLTSPTAAVTITDYRGHHLRSA
jgi:hypothetical protein